MTRGFFGRWRDGIVYMSPLRRLNSKLWGIAGQFVGLLFAMVAMIVLTDFWFFIFFMLFTEFLLALEFIGCWQQYKRMRGF